MLRKKLFITAVVLSCTVLGCGYRLATLSNPLLDDISTIAVPYFKNKTFEAEAVTIFTNAFVNEFIESRRLKVVSVDEADVILHGTIKRLHDDTIAYSRDDKAMEYRIHAIVAITLEEKFTGKVLWKRKDLYHTEEYPVSNDIATSETSKRAVLHLLAADLAERVHDSIMQGF